MSSYHELKQQRLEELKADPDYADSRKKYRMIGAIIGLVIGLAITFFGANFGIGIAAIVALVLLGALIGGWIKSMTTKSAASAWAHGQFNRAWAAERNLEYLETSPIYHDVPMLQQGERHETAEGFTGELMPNVNGTVYNFTYYTRETRTTTDSDGNRRTETYWKPHPQTVLRLELCCGLGGLSLKERSWGGFKLFDGLDSKLTSQRVVELESIEFNKKFKLEVHDEDDDILIRQLFDPQMIMHFVDNGSGFPAMETSDSTVVFMRPGYFTCADSDGLGEIEQLLDEAKPIVKKMHAIASQAAA